MNQKPAKQKPAKQQASSVFSPLVEVIFRISIHLSPLAQSDHSCVKWLSTLCLCIIGIWLSVEFWRNRVSVLSQGNLINSGESYTKSAEPLKERSGLIASEPHLWSGETRMTHLPYHLLRSWEVSFFFFFLELTLWVSAMYWNWYSRLMYAWLTYFNCHIWISLEIIEVIFMLWKYNQKNIWKKS